MNTDISEAKQLKEILNKSKITYTVSAIPKQSKSYSNIGLTYDGNEITKFEGLAVEENYGLKCTDLYDKYIYVENNNLKTLAKKFGISSTSIPDKIETVDIYDLLYVSKDTREKIKDTYYNVLDEKLEDKMFSAQKNIETTVNGESVKVNAYSLTVTEGELYDILISLFGTLKNDDTTLDLIIDKLDKSNIKDSFEQGLNGYSSYGTTTSSSKTVTFDKNYLKNTIQELIDDLEEDKSTASDDNTAKLTVYVSNGTTVKIELTATDDSQDKIDVCNLEITKNKNSNNIISLIFEGETVFKSEYTVSNENNVKKSNGTLTITSDDVTIPINFNIEYSKDAYKSNVKATLPLEDTLGTSQKYFTDDIVIEFDSQINGELGKETNNKTSYISISSGDDSVKLNINEDITYTDDISIDDLNTSNGKCLNNMSVSEIETLLQEIVVNFQKVLPSKLELLGVDPSVLGISDTEEETDLTDDELTDNLANTTDEDSNTSTTDNSNDSLIPFLEF